MKATVRRGSCPSNQRRPSCQRCAKSSAAQRVSVRWWARQPRGASAVRVRNRDSIDGRPRGHLRKFGLSRVQVRELAHCGQLLGVRKASW
ncbi:uS14 family ribosomal protein [Mycobacterium camsae]|uniref:30S ribosomal protein S14 n=1 Tax=Mycobacterium gordonae TaxID=1778 RepID=UPI003D6632EF